MTSTEKGRCICPLKFVNYYRNHMTSCPLHIATPISDDRWVEGKVREFDTNFSQPHWEITGYNLNKVKAFIKNALLEAEKRGREML